MGELTQAKQKVRLGRGQARMSALKNAGTLGKKGQLSVGAAGAKNMIEGTIELNKIRQRQTTDGSQ